ncbi:MAG: hypothetical protein ACRDDZ_01050 [Marinifilaceae bacterium]
MLPILFIFFNRREIASNSFKAIKHLKPSVLYLASDGPRSHVKDETDIVHNLRKELVSQIDWPCTVHELFRETNLGCSSGVRTAIDWFFDHEYSGIILEDDCIISVSFYKFAEELLKRYEHDARIGMIAGYNQVNGSISRESSYIFSKYKACWGWATWRRAWKLMDINMDWRGTEQTESIIANMGYRSLDINYWKYRLNCIDKNIVSAWDWQWYFTLAANNCLTIFPCQNLISNIGFGESATHTQGIVREKLLEIGDLGFPLVHPKYIVPDAEFDYNFYKKNNSLYNYISAKIPFSIKKQIKQIILNRR